MRCEVVGAQLEAPVGVAHRVGEARAAGHDDQRVALPELAERCAQPRQRAVAEAAADLDDGQHSRAARSAASAAAVEPHRAGATARPSRAATSRARKAPAPTATTGASGGSGRSTRRAASSIWRSCSPCEEGGDRVDLVAVELVDVGAHQPRDPLAREGDLGRAAVGRGAVVRLGREMAEDEMDVGADREGLRRHGAPLAADRHARRDRGEVRAQHAGVDELAGQQPLEVVAAGRRNTPGGDRDDVGGRAADVDEQRVRMLARHRERRRHPVGGRDVPGPSARLPHRHELAGRRQHAQRPVAERLIGRGEDERHPLALRPERVRQLGRHGDRHGVRLTGLGGDLPQHGGERLAVAPDLERARDRPQRRRRPAGRPSCSRRRCPALAWPACASWGSSISRTARRSTPCAASANATARSATRSRSRAGSRARRAVRGRPRRDHRRRRERQP